MKSCLLAFLIFYLSLPAFAQYEGMHQADSIYKINHVKSRTVIFTTNDNKMRTQVELYDTKGRITSILSYYKSTNTLLTKRIYTYDSSGKNVNRYDSVYSKWDAMTREFKLIANGPIKDESIHLLEYDPIHRLSREFIKTNEGKLVVEIKYTYDPLTQEIQQRDGEDTITTFYRKTVYDRPEVPAHVYGYSRNGKTLQTFDNTFRNRYDKLGRVTERVFSKTNLDKKGINNTATPYKSMYQYNNKGLLVKIVTQNYGNSRYEESGVVFSYEYY